MDELKDKADAYKRKNARNIAIAVMMYILGVAILICASIINPAFGSQIGVVILLVFVALGTGLIVYSTMSIPQDVADFMKKNKYYGVTEIVPEGETESQQKIYRTRSPLLVSFMKLYWLVVTAIYLCVSFLTYAWNITWLIWIIAAAIEQAIKLIFDINSQKKDNINE